MILLIITGLLKMNTQNNNNAIQVADVIADPTCRLDVLYWKKFAVDLNVESKFSLTELSAKGHLRKDLVKNEVVQKDRYHTFKITYTGKVKLDLLIPNSIKVQNMKIVNNGNLVFSRINCCRGAIGIIQSFQDKSICTNETHIYQVDTEDVDVRYLQIILRHPYYQDRILSECTGVSLERMRFDEKALGQFQVPIPTYEKQLTLIKKVECIDKNIRNLTSSIEQIKHVRNKNVLSRLEIQLKFSKSERNQYGLFIDDVLENNFTRLDFEHNKPSFKKIKKLTKGKYPLIEIFNTDPRTQILKKRITSGSTPEGGIYPTKGTPFIQGKNIDENKMNMTDHQFITSDFHSTLARSQVNGGEVLITMAGTIGRTAVNNYKNNANINQAIAVLYLNEKINPLFLSAFLNSDGGKIQFAKHRHDFGTPNINLEELGKLKIPLPPINIQNKIALMVEEHERKILELKTMLSDQIKKRSEFITQFLIGKKTYEDVHERLK